MSKNELHFESAEKERVMACQRKAYREEMKNLTEYYFDTDRERARAEKFIRDNGLWEKYEFEGSRNAYPGR